MTNTYEKTDKKIIKYLEENCPSFLGELVKELKLSYSRGLKRTNYLLSEGIIKHSEPPIQYELNSEAK